MSPSIPNGEWAVVRTVEEIDAMVETLEENDDAPAWYGGTGVIFGADALWPLMVRVPKNIAPEHEATPLTTEAALDDLEERVDFLIDKADNERGLSAPKARDQVNMLLWLLGREDLQVDGDSFQTTAAQARRVKEAIDG